MSTLMHPRVAHNYAAMGYYPTDEATIKGISCLIQTSERRHSCLDPACGCGRALARLINGSAFPNAIRYGVELDPARACAAATRLDVVLQGSALDAQVTPGSIDLLFLNPPYGWGLHDTDVACRNDQSARLEHQFLKRFFSCLAPFGLMVYIIPKRALEQSILSWLYRHYDDIRIYLAAVDRFDQIVVIGRKRAAVIHRVDDRFIEYWQDIAVGDVWQALPSAPDRSYQLPETQKPVQLLSRTLEPQGLNRVKQRYQGLWSGFTQTFRGDQNTMARVRPIHDLSDWHTCLLITSGLVNGLIDNGKRRLLIKGKTTKVKKVKVITDDQGHTTQEEYRDHFTTVIKAIDLTPDSQHFGQIVVIQ